MKVTAFDIETGSAEELHSYGPGYTRLYGWQVLDTESSWVRSVKVSADPEEMISVLNDSDAITGHNIINFDLLALAKYHGADYEQLAWKSFDTIIAEHHFTPVAAKGAQRRGFYGLDSTAARYGVSGKSVVDFEGKRAITARVRGQKEAGKLKPGKTESFSVLKLLAALYGGFHLIPQDDPDYIYYLEQDVTASASLFRVMNQAVRAEPADSQRYIRREHYVAAALGRVTLEGFRVDTDLTMARWSAGQQRLEAGKQRLHEKYGMPREGRYPHRSNPGKAAFRKALLDTGISETALDANWPTGQDGSLLTGKDVLTPMAELLERTKPAAAELCRVIKAMNGERTIYGTVLDHLNGDRVHPYIGPDQSSGRWSMKDPGLTVFGKRGGKAAERAIMLADSSDEVLVAIDADQVDARVIAAECQDPEYMSLFEPGLDLHSEVAWRVWPHPHQHGPDCTPGPPARCRCALRDRGKGCGHGFSYGLGASAMAVQHGLDVTVAKRFIQGMTEAFPRLAQWKEEMRQLAGAMPYGEEPPPGDEYRILHTWAGRPVRVERRRAYTQACAQIGQGGTRDVMAEAILRLPAGYRRKLRAVIHDEIVLSLPKAGAQEAAQKIADSMAFDLKGVAITFGCSRVSPRWSGCYGEQYGD